MTFPTHFPAKIERVTMAKFRDLAIDELQSIKHAAVAALVDESALNCSAQSLTQRNIGQITAGQQNGSLRAEIFRGEFLGYFE